MLAGYCTKQGWNFQVIQDLGSGMNYQKKGLKALIQLILEREISRLVLTHKDRLLRFGAELIFALCEAKQLEVILINKGDEVSFEEELAQDILRRRLASLEKDLKQKRVRLCFGGRKLFNPSFTLKEWIYFPCRMERHLASKP